MYKKALALLTLVSYKGKLNEEQCRRRGSVVQASIIDVDSRTKERELFPRSPVSRQIPPPSQEGVSLSPFVNACRTLGAHVAGGVGGGICSVERA